MQTVKRRKGSRSQDDRPRIQVLQLVHIDGRTKAPEAELSINRVHHALLALGEPLLPEVDLLIVDVNIEVLRTTRVDHFVLATLSGNLLL